MPRRLPVTAQTAEAFAREVELLAALPDDGQAAAPPLTPEHVQVRARGGGCFLRLRGRALGFAGGASRGASQNRLNRPVPAPALTRDPPPPPSPRRPLSPPR